MPKNTRMTVATTTATRAIIAMKLGPSGSSIVSNYSIDARASPVILTRSATR